ncbi:MAG: hypothetical protein H5U07_03095 [Candidatus Aminicenantes bacterium]|nr:hypothetical protein [Candidatus Aminicenantes bacterium]
MKKTLKFSLIFLICFVLVFDLQAVVPRKWELRTKEDFLKGKFNGLSLSSSGVISIGPRLEKWELPAEEFYLSLVYAANGVAFLGTGHSGKIYRLGSNRKAELYFQAAEMDVTALALDAKGQLYAATSPNGKIYRISAKGKGEEFFDPQEKYIWDLMFTEKGGLLAAVGESGGIYEISPAGEGRLVLKAKTNHILCLKRHPSGDVFAGSGGSGLLYRLSPGGRVSVVLESAYEEIRSLDFDREGNIYFTASGRTAKSSAASSPSSSSATAGKSQTEVAVAVSVAEDLDVDLLTSESESSSSSSSKTTSSARGAVFQVSADGLARKLWSSDKEIPYELFYEPESKKLIFGTGPEGRIYALEEDEKAELLTQAASEQIFRLLRSAGKIFVVGNNPCFFGQLPLNQNFSGEYLSPVLDAKIPATWGRIIWEAEMAAGSVIQVQTRSGNTAEPDETWSDWSPPYLKSGEKILSPNGRYLQVKVSLKAQSGPGRPGLSKLSVFYLQANVAPVIEKLEILPPNQVYLKSFDDDDVIRGLDQVSQEENTKKDSDKDIFISSKKALRQGFRTFTWEVSDANDDQLSYKVYIRKERETGWWLLQDKITEKLLSFDTRNFSDGTYFIKLEANDQPSNPAGTEKKVEKISQPFVIDNSLPMVKNFQTKKNGDRLEISFQVEDSYSYIEEVKFMIKPEEWQVVFPVDGLCDSQSESFKFTVRLTGQTDNLIFIRVRDSFGNLGTFQSQF